MKKVGVVNDYCEESSGDDGQLDIEDEDDGLSGYCRMSPKCWKIISHKGGSYFAKVLQAPCPADRDNGGSLLGSQSFSGGSSMSARYLPRKQPYNLTRRDRGGFSVEDDPHVASGPSSTASFMLSHDTA